MIQFFVQLAIYTLVTLQTSTDAKDISRDIAREFLPQLCPEIISWNGNQTDGTVSILEKDSCCTACSFDPSCDVNHGCCFPKESSATSVTAFSESECLYPMSTQVYGSQRRFYSSHWMVNDVKSYGNDTRFSNQSITKCGEEKVAPWGSFAPVHSKKTGKIYTNIACAEADNVTDGVLWDLLLICRQTRITKKTEDISSYISDLYLASSPKNCRIHFKYPGNVLDIKPEKCFTNLINTCKNEEFTIPQNLNLTMSQIRQACTSGLVSPYRARNMYQNVFCHICNGGHYSGKEKCYYDIDGKAGFNGDLISILADATFLSETFRRHEKKIRKVPLACPTNNTGDKMQESCRQVHCPSGQHRDDNNNCVLSIKKLYIEKYELYIKLTSDSAFDVEEIFDNNELSLRHKWPSVWVIKSVSKRILYKSMHRNLYITMINILPITDTAELLRNIRRFLKRPWNLILSNGTSISMSAELGYVTQFFVNIDSAKTSNQEGKKSVRNEIPQFGNLYNYIQNSIDKPTFILTKLYFCEQIELNPSEYELRDENFLYNKMTNGLLFFGEFSIVMSPLLERTGEENSMERARICFEDSGFMKLETNNVAVNSDADKYVLCITLTVFLYSLFF